MRRLHSSRNQQQTLVALQLGGKENSWNNTKLANWGVGTLKDASRIAHAIQQPQRRRRQRDRRPYREPHDVSRHTGWYVGVVDVIFVQGRALSSLLGEALAFGG